MYHVKALVWVAVFLEFSLYSAPLIVPITFRPSLRFKHIEKELFSAKITSTLVKTFTDFEVFMSKYNLSEVSDSLQLIRKRLSRFSMETLDKDFDAILAIKNACTDLGAEGQLCCQQLYTAIYLRAALELCKQADEMFVEAINTLEKNADYWDEQYVHSSFYFFHRSPLKWFKKGSRKSEILTNRKCISDVLHQYEGALGENALLRAEFNDQASVDEQFVWIKRCCVDISKLCLKNPLHTESITQENCGQIIKQLYLSLNSQGKRVQRQVRGATMPSHFERNWALYTGLTIAAVSGYLYMQRNPDVIQNNTQKLREFFVKNYTNHLKEPLLDIKNALFVSNDEVTSAAQKLKKMIQDTKSSEEVREEVKKDYVTVCNSVAGILDLPLDQSDLLQKAETLDQDYLDRLCQSVATTWQKGGFVVESYWKPWEATTKSKVLNVAPNMGILIYRVAKLTGRSIATNAAEILITRIDELERKLNLTVAVVSLLPAYFVLTKAISGIRSFGGFLLPKGYDDTPVKNCIIKMQDFLDDIVYIDALKAYDTLDAHSVGKLLYYSTQLEDEITHLSEKNRTVLKDLLEKFYITNDLKGKHMYLKKMLHEYESWSRFIQR